MDIFVDVITNTVIILIFVIYICMFLRFIMQFSQSAAESFFGRLAYTVAEIIIAPVRYFLVRFNILQGIPFDASAIISMLILWVLLMILP